MWHSEYLTQPLKTSSLDLEDNAQAVSYPVLVNVGYFIWSMDAEDISKAPIVEGLHTSHARSARTFLTIQNDALTMLLYGLIHNAPRACLASRIDVFLSIIS